jgi:hypothetical protein
MPHATELVVFFLPTITGSISLVTSCIIIHKIFSSETKLKSPYSRLIFGLSCHDIISSFANVLTGLPLPPISDIPNPDLYGIYGGAWGAVGNDITCRIQGLLFTFTCVTSPFYNLSLCIYFYCVIRHSMSDERFRQMCEPWLHAIPILYSVALATYVLASNYLYVNGAMCWISSKDPSEISFLQTFIMMSVALPILLIFIGIIVLMVLITGTVWKQEKRMDQYRFGLGILGTSTVANDDNTIRSPTRRRNSASKNRIRAASVQANLFFAAFVLTFTSTFAYRIMIGYYIETPDVIVILSQGLYPLQGFFNVFAHMHPQVASIRRANANTSYWSALWGALNSYDKGLDQRSSRHSTRRRRLTTRRSTTSTAVVGAREGDELLNSRAVRRSSRHLSSITTTIIDWKQPSVLFARAAAAAAAADDDNVANSNSTNLQEQLSFMEITSSTNESIIEAPSGPPSRIK